MPNITYALSVQLTLPIFYIVDDNWIQIYSLMAMVFAKLAVNQYIVALTNLREFLSSTPIKATRGESTYCTDVRRIVFSIHLYFTLSGCSHTPIHTHSIWVYIYSTYISSILFQLYMLTLACCRHRGFKSRKRLQARKYKQTQHTRIQRWQSTHRYTHTCTHVPAVAAGAITQFNIRTPTINRMKTILKNLLRFFQHLFPVFFTKPNETGKTGK